MKQQVLYINGGVPKENYESYYEYLDSLEYNPYEEKILNWNKTLGKHLGDDFEYLEIPFPNKQFADYQAWKIMFKKVLPFLQNNIIIIAGSLGGTFLLKYISEERMKITIKGVFFLAVAIKDTPDELLGSFAFDLEKSTKALNEIAERIYIYHSIDDDVVPFEQSVELKKYLPNAIFREFTDRGHFYKELRLPELEADLKN